MKGVSDAIAVMGGKTVVAGGYGWANAGDDALMLTTVSIISKCRPYSEIAIAAPGGGTYVRAWLPSCDVIYGPMKVKAEALCYGGGTLFYSFPGMQKALWNRALGKAKSILQDPRRLVHRLCGHPLRCGKVAVEAEHSYAVDIGLGPFTQSGQKAHDAEYALRKCEYISVRDPSSRALCLKWGIDKAQLRADLCFSSHWRSVSGADGSEIKKCLRHIGIVVRDWQHSPEGAAFKAPIQKAVRELRAHGYKVDYVLFQNDPGWRACLARSGEQPLSYNPERDHVGQFTQFLSRFDLMITARAHGAILPAGLGVPSICIAVEPKLRYVCESLKHGSLLWEHPFSVSSLLQMVDEVKSDPRAFSESTIHAVKEQRYLADMSAEELVSAMRQSRMTRSHL